MTTQAPPIWYEYAIFVGGGSDKFYAVTIDIDDRGYFVLTKRWGRRPDTGGGQTKVENYGGSLANAQRAARAHMQSKVDKGYRRIDWPL